MRWCPTFSIYKPNSNSASFRRFLEGDELRICNDTETEFLAGLARVMAETLSRSGRVSRVRSGPGRVTGLRHFSYPGVVGLAGLGRVTARVTRLRHFPFPWVIGLARLGRVKLGMAKTSSRVDFSLIPQPGLG
jgi:hypothetical protein